MSQPVSSYPSAGTAVSPTVAPSAYCPPVPVIVPPCVGCVIVSVCTGRKHAPIVTAFAGMG